MKVLFTLFLALQVCVAASGNTTTVIDVTDPPYSAVGDGISDDHSAIQAAVEALRQTGGTILLPAPYQFALSSPILLSNLNSISIRGGGQHVGSCTTRGASLLSLTSNSTVLILNQCGHCSVSNLFIGHILANGNATGAHISLLAQSKPHSINTDLLPLQRSTRSHSTVNYPTYTVERRRPQSGCSIVVRHSFEATIDHIWFESVWGALRMEQFANTMTVLDTTIVSVWGPFGIRMAGGSTGARVDVLQISRLTTNNYVTDQNTVLGNASVVWLDMASGANTLRLDNVGLIHGGIGLRLSSEDPTGTPGVSPGRPLFVFANDLEIDFPLMNAIQLDQGETVTLSNAYLQGSQTKNGIFVGPGFNSELQVTNSRIFGHSLSGIVLGGGRHHLFTNNIVGDNSIVGVNVSSGILVKENVSDFIITSNHVGAVFKQQIQSQHKYGIEIEKGSSNHYIITSNALYGNIAGGLFDGGEGKSSSVDQNLL